jgi:hypothetical protein
MEGRGGMAEREVRGGLHGSGRGAHGEMGMRKKRLHKPSKAKPNAGGCRTRASPRQLFNVILKDEICSRALI